ncbi:hypothetical protein D3C85_1633310 [compost metagenome]
MLRRGIRHGGVEEGLGHALEPGHGFGVTQAGQRRDPFKLGAGGSVGGFPGAGHVQLLAEGPQAVREAAETVDGLL